MNFGRIFSISGKLAERGVYLCVLIVMFCIRLRVRSIRLKSKSTILSFSQCLVLMFLN